MPRKPRKWPSYALWALEDVQALLFEIGQLARRAQQAAADGNRLEAVMLLGDVRERAARATAKLVEARAGEYGKGGDDLGADDLAGGRPGTAQTKARREPG